MSINESLNYFHSFAYQLLDVAVTAVAAAAPSAIQEVSGAQQQQPQHQQTRSKHSNTQMPPIEEKFQETKAPANLIFFFK